MDVNIIQALLVFIVAFIMGIDQFSFLESLYQPIVLGPIIGAILGNFELGIVVGGAYQLVQIGSMPIGGAQPPNAIMGTIMTAVFAVSMNLEPTAEGVGLAVGLAIPFAVFGQYAVTLTFTIMSGLMAKADKAAEEADGKASPAQHIAIICETPQDVLRLVEGGVPIKKVNIGNMHMADGKRQVATSVAVDDDDVATFKKLQDLGVELEIKRVPDTPVENLDKLFK